MENLDIVAIGESLIELSSDISLHYADSLTKYVGSDVTATCVAASRLGSKIGFISKVGNDFFKEFLIDSWKKENFDISQVKIEDAKNGIYLLSRPSNGDKEIMYYRQKSAATKLSIDDIDEEYIKSARMFYSTGTSQSLSLTVKEAVKKAYSYAKKNGLMTAYDPNFTSKLMTQESAKEALNEIIEYVDILFMNTEADVQNIFESTSVENIAKYFWELGVSTIILKSKTQSGYYTAHNGKIEFTEFYTKENIVDTTCSGDSFNGGFLNSVLKGLTPFEATKLAAIVAGLQAQNIGAIKSIPSAEEIYAILNGANNAITNY